VTVAAQPRLFLSQLCGVARQPLRLGHQLGISVAGWLTPRSHARSPRRCFHSCSRRIRRRSVIARPWLGEVVADRWNACTLIDYIPPPFPHTKNIKKRQYPPTWFPSTNIWYRQEESKHHSLACNTRYLCVLKRHILKGRRTDIPIQHSRLALAPRIRNQE
jgi:hypothetical protein